MNNDLAFRHYVSNIEEIPFSDEEARDILCIDIEEFERGIKSGMIKRSILKHYRFNQDITFIGFFDLLEYSLRKKFFFLVYKSSDDINELVCSLVDEIALLIDLQTAGDDRCLTLGNVLASLKHLCNEYEEEWMKYWLCNGEKFSSEKCSILTMKSWCSLFDLSMLKLGTMNGPVPL